MRNNSTFLPRHSPNPCTLSSVTSSLTKKIKKLNVELHKSKSFKLESLFNI